MIYPILHIDSNNIKTINFIDTDFTDNPFLSIIDNDADELLIPFLTAFLNQYNNGYEDAIDDGMLGKDDIYE